jgi:hypothetical protein
MMKSRDTERVKVENAKEASHGAKRNNNIGILSIIGDLFLGFLIVLGDGFFSIPFFIYVFINVGLLILWYVSQKIKQ